MSADIVNLRRVRKAKARSDAADLATANRAKFGRSGDERDIAAARSALAERRLDGHRIEDPATSDASQQDRVAIPTQRPML